MRVPSAKTTARDELFLAQYRSGRSTAQIAEGAGLKVRAVQLAIARASSAQASAGEPEDSGRRIRPPRLTPLFPIQPFTPGSACPHHGPIRPGSALCCMVCAQSGLDDHPALFRDPRTDPRPEKRPAPATSQGRKETRREKRRKMFKGE